MRRSLLNILNTPKLLRHALILITMLLLPNTAWGQNYDLWIGETQVTGTNASNITGNGTVSFEQPSTLTLNNATLTVGIKSSLSSLTIQLKGNSSIITNGSCIYTEGNTETLTIISGEQAGGDCSLTLQNKSTENSVIKGFTNMGEGSLTSSSNAAYNKNTKSLCSSTDNSKVITAVTYAANYYNISIGQTQIAKGIDNVVGEGITSGTVTFDGSTNTLTLDNAIIDHITSWIGNLTIKVKGANTISSNSIPIGSTSPENYSLTITKETDGDEASIDIINTTTANTAIFGFFSLTYTGFIPYDSNSDSKKFIALNYDSSSKELKNTSGSSINHVFFKEGSVYPLQIGDTQVTSENAGNILNDDKVSFTPANGYNASTISTWATLTLDNATINGSIEWSETVYPNLRIVVNGTCKVIKETEGDTPLPAIKYSGTGTPTVHISKNSTDATLLIASYKNKGTSNGSVFSGFNSTIGVDDGLHQTTLYPDDGENYQIRYTCYTTAKVYDLAVAGIQVHEISSDFQGYKEHILKGQLENSVYTRNTTVTFDGTQLTLNNAAIETSSSANAIITGLDLSINLIGTNTITTASGYAFSRSSQESRTVSFTSSSSPAGTLTLSKSLDPQGLTSGITLDTTGGWTVTYSGSATNLENATQAIITKGALTGIEIAGTLITSEYLDGNGVISGVSGITSGTVKFTPADNTASPATPATLTLNDAVLTAPIIIGLSKLTIDIQGTNSITTEEKCIQKMENTTPAVTFTSTSDVVGSLTLKGAAGVNNLGVDDKGSFTITDKLALVLKKGGDVYSNQYYFMDEHTTEAILSPSYGVTVGGMQICQDNAADVIGEGIGNGKQGGMVKFTPAASDTPATLTLNGATISGTIKSSLNDLIIKIAGSSNTLTAILYEGSSNGTLLFQNAPSSSSNVNKLTLQNSTGAVFSGFSTVTLDGLFFSTPNYPSVTTSTDWTSSIIEAIITNEYGITIGGVDVTTTNKDDVLNDEGTVKFTPADNTATPATPATLTLNGAKITGTVFWTNSAPLTIAINGTNSVTTTDAYAIKGNNQDNTTLTIAKVSETGKCKLILSGSSVGSISGFKNSSDTYAGSGLVYYEDQEEYTATILSTLSGSGTSTDPYLIETPEDLKDFSFFVNKQIITNKYIKIANNIDCKDLEGFESIGSSYPFMGTLSGYGNTISNLTINSGLGFFGHISGGIVNDLNFYKLSVKGNSYATGGIASELSAGGQIDNCTLTECTIACLDNQYSPEVGGIVARLSDSGSKISNCVVYNSTINASTIYTGGSGPIGYAGGIVASYSSGTITNCHVKDGSKIINVNADGGSTLKTGALVGNLSSGTTTSITSNFYYYDVTVETQLGSSAKETKSGYTPRGTSDNTEDPTGAMLYTKNVIIPISTDAGHVSIGSDYYYQVTSDDTNATYSVAPDVEVVISVENADVEGSYTLDEAKTIELKPKEGSTGLYTFDMPNADVTFTVQEAAAVSFSEEGQIYVTYYNATKDVAVPMGMTAYIVTGVSEDGTKVIVSPVSYIKKGVAVLIEKDKTTEVSETTDFSGNKLIYAENDVPVTTESKLYVLYQNQFVKVTSGTQIPTGKNYLDLSTSTNAGTRGFYDIGGANDGTSALRGVVAEGTNGKSDAWYTLQGRRLPAKPTKSGLYLHNGIKVVVK